MLDESPAVRDTLTSTSSREAANRRDFKDFLGGQLYLEHAGSPQRLKSTSVRTLIVDEVDEFAASLSSGDDPIEMLEGRTSAFPSTCRRLYISTPTLRHASRIEWLYDRSDKRRYYVPCPHCGHEQPLVWSGLRWGPGGTGVHYVCEDCGAEIAEHHKTAMIAAGRWVAEAPGARTVGYALNGLYYQIGLGPRWAELVAKWLEAQDDPAKLKTFVNDRLAETWEDPSMRAVRHDAVADRAESYPLRTVPSGGLALTAGVDTQDNRLAVQIVAWGSGMRCWVLDYVELPGDPAAGAVWDALTDLLTQPLQCEEGGTLHVLATAIDAGGHRTEAVKDFVRQRRITRPMAIFGAVPNNAPILSRPKAQDVHWRGGVDKSGVVIYHVGTVAAKHWLYGRLSADAERPPEMRHVHTTDHLPREYFGMLTSETFDPRKNRFAKRRGARNEGLDTWVYAFAAAHHPELRLHRATGADWARMADRVRTATVIADTPTVVTRHIDASPARKPAPASGGRAW
jgi:phage terminase large subunit GpA-like protein